MPVNDSVLPHDVKLERKSSPFVVSCPNLSKTIAAVVRRLASEASAERAFYAMRLTFTPERASMWPESVAMAVRALSFAKPSVQRALHFSKPETDEVVGNTRTHIDVDSLRPAAAAAPPAAAPADEEIARSVARINACQAIVQMISEKAREVKSRAPQKPESIKRGAMCKHTMRDANGERHCNKQFNDHMLASGAYAPSAALWCARCGCLRHAVHDPVVHEMEHGEVKEAVCPECEKGEPIWW